MWQGSEYANVTQGSKYATILLNISGQDVINANVPDMSEFTIIDKVLNMYHTIYSGRSLYNLMNTY